MRDGSEGTQHKGYSRAVLKCMAGAVCGVVQWKDECAPPSVLAVKRTMYARGMWNSQMQKLTRAPPAALALFENGILNDVQADHGSGWVQLSMRSFFSTTVWRRLRRVWARSAFLLCSVFLFGITVW